MIAYGVKYWLNVVPVNGAPALIDRIIRESTGAKHFERTLVASEWIAIRVKGAAVGVGIVVQEFCVLNGNLLHIF